MNGWLLDTNVVSELKRPRPDQRVRCFVAAQPALSLFLSVVTLAEIRFGIEKLDDALRRQDLTLWLDRTLRPLFERRILPLTEDILLRWRQMVEHGRKRGHVPGQPDLLIAATAAHEDLIVVTRDTAGFAMAAVTVLDPWSGILTRSGDKIVRLTDLDRPDLLATAADLLRGRH